MHIGKVTTIALLTAAICNSAWAQTHTVQNGSTTWVGDKTFSGNAGWPGAGIMGNVGNDGTIYTNGNIESTNNERGVFVLDYGSKVTFQNSDSSKTFKVDNNLHAGIAVENSSSLTINNMNVSASNNSNATGARISSGSKLNINDATTIAFNHNSASGLSASDTLSTINITGKNDNSSFLYVNNNNAGNGWGAGIWSENGGLINIKDTNIMVNGNGLAGMMLWNGGAMQITGNGNHTLQVTNNGLGHDGGIVVKSSALDISGMNVQIDNNGTFGMQVAEGSMATFTGSGGIQNVLTANGNAFAGLASMNLASYLNIIGMNIQANNNGTYGLRATDGGVINITGVNNNTLEVVGSSGTESNGIVAYSGASGSQSHINIVDMDILIEDQFYQGIAARDGGLVTITSNTGTNLLEVYNTRWTTGSDAGKGIHAKEIDNLSGSASTIVIKDMDVIANNNELEGLVAANGGQIYIESNSSNNTLTANDNRDYSISDTSNWTYGAGLLAHGVSSIDTSQYAAIIIENMNVETSNNGLYGIYVRDGATINIAGDGSQTLDVIGNKSTVNDEGTGIGVAGVDTASGSAVAASMIIENMEITVKDNGKYGIDITEGAQMLIRSTQGNTLTVSNNHTTNNEGIGINVYSVSNGVRSRLDIEDMDVFIDNSADAGIKVNDGGLLNITSSTSTNVLTVNNNNNNGAQYNEGSGIWAFGANASDLSTINLIGLNIEAKNNGSYGVISEGGSINIAGDGTHTLNLDGNARYGLLAKDGGSVDVSGMVVSGDSLSHSFIAIEREGLIQFTDSAITTDTDTLFYTWSDSNTQTSKFILDNSSAIGNGTKLAYFGSHNGILEATDSYLENAIVTDSGAGVSSTVSLNTSTWLMKDTSNITDLTVSDSIVDMRKTSGYTTLTLDKLTSSDSIYHLNTYFDFAGLTTDKIIVNGDDATGTDNVLVVHSAGYENGTSAISGYGIQVVNLDYATSKSIDFSLLGGVVDSGAYEYWLYRAADDNYYLQTDYRASTTTNTIINAPAIHLSIVKTGLNEFRKRITELREYDTFHPEEVWVRMYGKHLKVSDTIDSKMNLYGVEVGYDNEVNENEDEDNKYYVGVMAGYMYADNIVHHNAGRPNGTATANTPSVGIYGVWDNSDGWYSYATLRHFWSHMKAENYTSAGELITYKPNRNYVAATFELGKQFEYIVDEDRKWIFEPKGELRYAYAKSSSFETSKMDKIHYGSSKSFTTRAAVLFGYNYKSDSKAIYEPFVEVGVSKEWLGDTDVSYAGGTFYSEQKGTDFDASVGIRAKINDKWSFMGNVGYEKGSVHKGVGGQLAVRYSWE